MKSDAISTEVIRSKLESLDNEMLYLLYRSAYSTLMRESRDCSYQMTGPSGELVTDGSVRGQYAIQYLLQNFKVEPNEIWISNHPYQTGVQHTPDLMVTVPIVHEGIRLGFSSTVAHKSDSGGALVGSVSMQSTEIYQEGLLLPFMKVGEFTDKEFELDDRITRMIAANVRDPDLYLGDFRAQVGVTLVGRQRILELAKSVGTATLLGAYEEIQNLGERMIRRHLASWNDGSVTVEAFLDSDGVNRDRPVRYELKVTKSGEAIEFDLSGSDDQTTGPVNITPPYMEGNCIYPSLLSMTDPSSSFNSGICRAVRVIVRPGSVFNPAFPAPVGATTTASYRVTDMVLEALSHFATDRAVGNSGGAGGSTALLWQNVKGTTSSRSMQYEVLMTAQGASLGHDGCNGTGANFYNSPLTPIEILEAQFPVRIGRFELIRDSGGPGRYRGGLSYRRQYVCLAPATLNRRADRGKFPAKGIHGGKSGTLHRLLLNPYTDNEQKVPIAGRYQFQPGESFMGEGAGAGGYGDPFERDPQAVARDVASAYVSKEAAERDYGVILHDDGTVDELRTAQVRTSSRTANNS